MSFFDNIKVFNKKSSIRKEVDDIIGKLPSSDIIAKDILNKLDNKKTKSIFDKDIKGNYYVYLNNTIYLSDRQNEKSNYERLCVIAHECIHSIQPKILQNLNFILSNLEVVIFVVYLLLFFLKVNIQKFYLVYLIIAIFSLVIRTILELWAISRAPKLSKEYLEEKNVDEINVKKVENVYNFSTKLLTPFALIQMFFWKILRIIAIILITCYKF